MMTNNKLIKLSQEQGKFFFQLSEMAGELIELHNQWVTHDDVMVCAEDFTVWPCQTLKLISKTIFIEGITKTTEESK
jgi:hypothetical protein